MGKLTTKHGLSQNNDTAPKSKKVKFDEDGVIQKPKKLMLLSESEEEEEEEEYVFPDVKEVHPKLSKLQSAIGNDSRFVVDERFLEDEDLQEKEDNEQEVDEYAQEKQKQLEILGSVLGKPISPNKVNKNEGEKSSKNKGFKEMIRYDPSNEEHKKYEITGKKPEEVKKKKKEKKKIEEEKAPEPEVSKDIFYSVSDKLKDVVWGGEQFSLLKALGKELPESNNEQSTIPYEYESQKKPFGFNFKSDNVFKYDSSDEEETNDKIHRKILDDKSKSKTGEFFSNSNRFFFIENDPRFQEAKEFFSQRSNVDLKTLRPLLKQTMRKKIRNNLKKQSATYKKQKRRKY